jgi:hypothetical protein
MPGVTGKALHEPALAFGIYRIESEVDLPDPDNRSPRSLIAWKLQVDILRLCSWLPV